MNMMMFESGTTVRKGLLSKALVCIDADNAELEGRCAEFGTGLCGDIGKDVDNTGDNGSPRAVSSHRGAMLQAGEPHHR